MVGQTVGHKKLLLFDFVENLHCDNDISVGFNLILEPIASNAPATYQQSNDKRIA
jgi:hypothetical protein